MVSRNKNQATIKLECLQDELAKGLGIVSRAVQGKTTLPICRCVLMQTDGGRLKLTATNLETAITYWMDARIETEGAVAIPASLLKEVVTSWSPEKMAIVMDKNQIDLVCGNSHARISVMKAEDFPPTSNIDTAGVSTRVDGAALRKALGYVTFAAATEESRPVLTGVAFRFEGKVLTLAAADGFRLAVYKTECEEVKEKVEFIVPGRTLKGLMAVLESGDEPVDITASAGAVMFRRKNLQVVSCLIQGSYPKFEQLIPGSHMSSIKVNRAAFIQAANAAHAFAHEGNDRICLVSKDKSLEVFSSTEDVGDGNSGIDASIEGEGTKIGVSSKIGVSAKYLIPLLKVMETDTVVMETTTPSSPMVFRSEGVDYVHIIMPIFVQWDEVMKLRGQATPAVAEVVTEPSEEPVSEPTATAEDSAPPSGEPKRRGRPRKVVEAA